MHVAPGAVSLKECCCGAVHRSFPCLPGLLAKNCADICSHRIVQREVFRMRNVARTLALLLILAAAPALGQAPPENSYYAPREIIYVGNQFFGGVSTGLAQLVEHSVSRWGLPNGYILGHEAGGAFFGGVVYGEGTLVTRNAGAVPVYWQGPSLGWDFGGDGARTMMLVYNLPAVQAVYQRFGGVAGSAYLVGGLGMTVMSAENMVVVPIRSGVGLRLGANLGYVKFTPWPTWNPF
jgi:hypothetical protein